MIFSTIVLVFPKIRLISLRARYFPREMNEFSKLKRSASKRGGSLSILLLTRKWIAISISIIAPKQKQPHWNYRVNSSAKTLTKDLSQIKRNPTINLTAVRSSNNDGDLGHYLIGERGSVSPHSYIQYFNTRGKNDSTLIPQWDYRRTSLWMVPLV